MGLSQKGAVSGGATGFEDGVADMLDGSVIGAPRTARLTWYLATRNGSVFELALNKNGI